MKMHTKLFIAGAILLIIPGGLTALFGFLCIIGGFILLITKGITEITNKNNTPNNSKSNTPPWEK